MVKDVSLLDLTETGDKIPNDITFNTDTLREKLESERQKITGKNFRINWMKNAQSHLKLFFF